jgi:hypothetical protein
MGKLVVTIWIVGFAITLLSLVVASAYVLRTNTQSRWVALLALIVSGFCFFLALLMQIVNGSTQGPTIWYLLPALFFLLSIAIFAAKKFPAASVKVIYLLTFLSAASLAIGTGYVIATEMKTKWETDTPRWRP